MCGVSPSGSLLTVSNTYSEGVVVLQDGVANGPGQKQQQKCVVVSPSGSLLTVDQPTPLQLRESTLTIGYPMDGGKQQGGFLCGAFLVALSDCLYETLSPLG